jgi:hypothetical protein
MAYKQRGHLIMARFCIIKYTPMKPKKKKALVRIVICGSRKWTNNTTIKKALREFDYKEVDTVIIGTAPGAEKLALMNARAQRFNIVQALPNVTRDGINAIYFRNDWIWRVLKPTHLLIFDTDWKENKEVTQHVKIARSKQIDYVHFKK